MNRGRHENNELSPVRLARLYARGHQLGPAVALLAGVLVVSVLFGTTTIPIPWATRGALSVPLNCLLAVVLVAALATSMTTPLAAVEEHTRGHDWTAPDALTLLAVLAGPALLALCGAPGLIQYALVAAAAFFSCALLVQPTAAFTAVVLGTVVQFALVAVIDESWLPAFWPASVPVSTAGAILCLGSFTAARRAVKTATPLSR